MKWLIAGLIMLFSWQGIAIASTCGSCEPLECHEVWTKEEIEQRICCLRNQAKFLHHQATFNWYDAYRLLYRDVLDYKFLMHQYYLKEAEAKALEDEADALEQLINP